MEDIIPCLHIRVRCTEDDIPGVVDACLNMVPGEGDGDGDGLRSCPPLPPAFALGLLPLELLLPPLVPAGGSDDLVSLNLLPSSCKDRILL